MRHLLTVLLTLLVVSCTGKWQKGDAINNGHDFLCNAGICDDSLNVANDINYNDDGKDLPHHILTPDDCEALQLSKMMQVDTNTSIVRVWGMRDYPDKGFSLLLGQTTYGDMRTCWLATYGKDGMLDFMRIGECGGLNLLYWDDIDEHTRNVGIDSMRLVMPDKWGKPMQLSRWISYKVQSDGVETDSTLWFIHHELPITIGNDGHFNVGKIGTVYSSDSTVLTPYWRNRRAMELFAWTPMSDTTIYDRVNAFLVEAEGTITDPTQLLGDFNMLMFTRLYCDTERYMQWCLDHPDSPITKATVAQLKEVNPEYILDEFKKIKDPALLQKAKQLLGL